MEFHYTYIAALVAMTTVMKKSNDISSETRQLILIKFRIYHLYGGCTKNIENVYDKKFNMACKHIYAENIQTISSPEPLE